MSDTITIEIDGKTKTVAKRDYALAKLRQLLEFGYPDLTIEEVQNQIESVLKGEQFGAGLTVIGMFMEKEIRKP